MSPNHHQRQLELLIVGAGAAGLAAAIRAWDHGIRSLLVVDRDPYPGGILRQCIHTGFGLEYYKEDLTGPEYLARLRAEADKRRIEVMLETTVTGLQEGPRATLISHRHGVVRVDAQAVVLATGSYERTRENLRIAGSRPAGVFTAGQAQQLINLFGYRIGKRVVVQGTGDIGLIMTRRLQLEGYEVLAVFERLRFVVGLLRNKVQCLDDFEIEPQFEHQIVEIHGASRVAGVTVAQIKGCEDEARPVAGTERLVACDTVVLSAGLLPNRELLGLAQDEPIDANLHSSLDGVFVAGNALEIHDLADGASAQGEYAADRAVDRVRGIPLQRTVESHRPGQFRSRWSVPARDVVTTGVVCIVCPRGCILTDEDIRCRRGAEFLQQERRDKHRVTTTTTWIHMNGTRVRVAARSKLPQPFAVQKQIVRQIKHGGRAAQQFEFTDVGER